jgi:phenylacetate-CoA ligase
MKVPAALAGRLIYPVHERVFGRPTFDYFSELERTQWLDRAGIQALQLGRLRELLRVAYDNSPWHRDRMDAAGLRADEIASLADLAKLPRMDKRDAALNADRIGAPCQTMRSRVVSRCASISDAAGRRRTRPAGFAAGDGGE